MATYETFEHDVLVIGAGGAGLRAAIEASAAGVKVGLVCKSLLGKAHTVMAEGGMAAAMGNVDDRDNWRVHFADTMRGGQYVNNWRMAELHAKEAPARVHELEAWGAVFDRTPDGRILQRNFGGHRYPRLAHVGDRTGLEVIRTLQDHGIHQGIQVFMEHTIVTLLKDGERVVGAFSYIVGKYVEYEDSYKSLKEALVHGALAYNLKLNVNWIEAEGLEQKDQSVQAQLEHVDGILVPGGFGKRGIEGMLKGIQHARENKVPFFGICLGMQTACIEFARHVCGLEQANSSEFDPATPHRVIYKLS